MTRISTHTVIKWLCFKYRVHQLEHVRASPRGVWASTEESTLSLRPPLRLSIQAKFQTKKYWIQPLLLYSTDWILCSFCTQKVQLKTIGAWTQILYPLLLLICCWFFLLIISTFPTVLTFIFLQISCIFSHKSIFSWVFSQSSSNDNIFLQMTICLLKLIIFSVLVKIWARMLKFFYRILRFSSLKYERLKSSNKIVDFTIFSFKNYNINQSCTK